MSNQINGNYLRNVIGAALLNPRFNKPEDYFCLAVSTGVTHYFVEQARREVDISPAELRMLWFINTHLVLLENRDLLGDGKRFVKESCRWLFKDFAPEMKPFRGLDMESLFYIFQRDASRLEKQRRAQNHESQTIHECCVAMFEERFNPNEDLTTTQLVMESILKALEKADEV